jgi:type IV secretory pathway VirB4 component
MLMLCSKPAQGYSDKARSNYPDPVTAAIDEERRNLFERNRHPIRELLYRNAHVLAAHARTTQVCGTHV